MDELVYNALEVLFGGRLISDVTDFLSNVMGAMTDVFNTNVGSMIKFSSRSPAPLMTIYLFVDVMDKATKDMITLERLIMILVNISLQC